MIVPSLPITETLAALPLTKEERAALVLPPAARTAGDLRVCLERKEVEAPAAVLRKIVRALDADRN